MPGGPRINSGRKPKEDAKTATLSVRMSPEDLEDVKETARYHNVSVTRLVRMALGLDKPKG